MNKNDIQLSTKNTVEKTEGSCLQDEETSQYGGIDNMSCLEAGQQRSTVAVGDRDNLAFNPTPELRGSIQNPTEHSDSSRTVTSHKDGRTLVSPTVGYGLKNRKSGKVDNDVIKSSYVATEEPCGIGVCHPQCLQRFRSIGCFSFLYGLSGIMMSALSAYINSQITTLEKHFNFNSSVSGFLMSCNDIGYFLTCLFLSYLTRRIHIPRCLALAALLYGLSGLMCTIPYFGTKNVIEAEGTSLKYGNTSSEMGPGQMCIRGTDMANNSSNSCDDVSKNFDSGGGIHGVSQHWRNLAITFIGLGMVIQGIAKSPRCSFVSVYIDDNVPKTRTTLYLGVISGMSIFGPAMAFIMGGFFSSVYITLEDTNMSNTDPRWLGAWWLGFLMFGSVSLVVGIPLLFFPRKIMIKPEIELVEKNRKMKGEGKNKVVVEAKEFFKAVTNVLTNPLYVMLVVAGGLNALSLSGSMSFAPKYLEAHFNVPTWIVNTVLGLMKVGGASIGVLVGGVVTSKYRLMPMTCLKFKISITVIVLFLQTAGLFIKCDQPAINSGTDTYSGNVSRCTSSCGCNDISFYPVCGGDNKNYFSPCHAGCTDVIDGGKTFSNCSCLSSPDISTAKGGLCDGGCSSMFWLYCILGFGSTLGLGFAIMPAFITVVRSVPEDQKPMALGISSFLHTLIGWFPGPIVFGMIVDSTCLVTQSSPCGQEFNKNGACLLYDLADLRIRYHSAILTLRFICICLYLAAFLYVKSSSTPMFFAHDDEKGDNIEEDDKEYDDGGVGCDVGGEGNDKNKLLYQCR